MAERSLHAPWPDKLQQLRWRAIEEADVEGGLLGSQLRAEATRQAGDDGLFLQRRVDWLETHATRAREVTDTLQWPTLSLWASAGWIVAFGLGYGLTELGESGLMNLLSVPLVGIVLWNVAVTITSLIVEWKSPTQKPSMPLWLRGFATRWMPASSDALTTKVIARFRAMTEPLIVLRATSRARTWMHLAAALLALGTVTGMYAKGWSKEYRAVWESTLLDAPTAKAFLSALHGPTSKVLGRPLPLEHFDAMRAGPGREPHPGDALPWINLYAGTLLLLVLLPRLGLAALAWWRGSQRIEVAWHKLDWAGYASRLRMTITGGGKSIEVLAYGWRAGEEPRDRWAEVIRERFGGLARLQFAGIPSTEEEPFVSQWTPSQPLVVLVFNAASTPEEEVHAALARDLRARLRQHLATARLIALLDTTSLIDRRTKEAVEARLKLWQATLEEWVDEAMTTNSDA